MRKQPAPGTKIALEFHIDAQDFLIFIRSARSTYDEAHILGVFYNEIFD
jgi:hypothetical protein